MALTSREETPDLKPTFDDLKHAMADLSHAQGEVKNWADRAKAARSALDSHEREQAKAQLEADAKQAKVDLILKKMGR